MPKRKITTRRGDSWIGLARKHKVNFNDFLYWNGVDPSGNLPALMPGQELYLYDPYTLDASYVSAKAPVNYVDYGQQGKDTINKYALAVKQGAMQFNDIPDALKTAVYQKMITNSTDKAAEPITKALIYGTLGALTGPAGLATGITSQKALAYGVDAASGRHEYDAGDLFKYTPITGRQYAEEHPVTATVVDVLGSMGPGIVNNMSRIGSAYGPILFQNGAATARAMGINPVSIPKVSTTGRKFAHVFQSSAKGLGSKGNKVFKWAPGWNEGKIPIGGFNHVATGETGVTLIPTAQSLIPTNITSPVWAPAPMTGGFILPGPDPDPRIHTESIHIYEQEPQDSPWVRDRRSNEPMGPYVPAKVTTTIGEAPIGGQQALTKETLKVLPTYKPRVATYVPGLISGTPSDIRSGLGITYTSSAPGPLIR